MPSTAHALDIHKCVYKRLETDEELRARFGVGHWVSAVALDEYVWNVHRKQRRIVEVVPE